MPDIPDQAILRRVEYQMQRQRQLHRPEAGREVSAVPGDGFQNHTTQFRGQLFQFGWCKPPQIGGGLQAIQY